MNEFDAFETHARGIITILDRRRPSLEADRYSSFEHMPGICWDASPAAVSTRNPDYRELPSPQRTNLHAASRPHYHPRSPLPSAHITGLLSLYERDLLSLDIFYFYRCAYILGRLGMQVGHDWLVAAGVVQHIFIESALPMPELQPLDVAVASTIRLALHELIHPIRDHSESTSVVLIEAVKQAIMGCDMNYLLKEGGCGWVLLWVGLVAGQSAVDDNRVGFVKFMARVRTMSGLRSWEFADAVRVFEEGFLWFPTMDEAGSTLWEEVNDFESQGRE